MNEKIVKQHYNNIAELYHKLPTQQFAKVIESLHVKPESAILDSGCGTGRLLAEIYGQTPYTQGVGIDISDKEIEIAERQNDISNISFRTGSTTDIPFEDRSFDIVISNMVLHHVDDHQAAFREMFRVLKPKGRLFVNALGDDSLTEYYSLLDTAWESVLGEKCPHAVVNFLNIDFIRSFLHSNGIKRYNLEIDRACAWAIDDPGQIGEFLDFYSIVGGTWKLTIDADAADAINRKIHGLIKDHMAKHGTYATSRTRIYLTVNK